jgi:signal transduction histidine kinase
LTPETVIFRYLEAANRQPLSVESFVRVLSSDADLLGRWLTLTALPADPARLNQTVAALSPDELRNLAQAQAWAVLPIAGSARLGLDQWQAVLRSAIFGELLAEELGMAEPLAVRWRLLLALSGVNLPQDRDLVELARFRGARPELLTDASLLVRIFSVVDARGVMDAAQEAGLAATLLEVSAETCSALIDGANERCQALLQAINVDPDTDADWSHRLWVQQQVSMLSSLLQQAENHEALQEAHGFVSRSLFQEVPLLLLDVGGGGYRSALAPDVTIHVDSTTSDIARVIREGAMLAIADRNDLSVGDRQLLRRLDTSEAACIPVRMNGHTSAVLLMEMDDDSDDDFTLSLYVVTLAQRLGTQAAAADELDLVTRYRDRELNRLRRLRHDAMNSLGLVQNNLAIFQMRIEDDSSAEQLLADNSAALRDVTELFQETLNLLPVAELETEQRAELEALDVNDVARQVYELHLHYAEERDVALSLDVAPGALLIRSSGLSLRQILNNLVRNGIEAATEERVILGTQTGVFREGREGVEIFVRDTGPGLPRAVLERLAEPKESTKGGEHAGLGLHNVFRLMSQLGGSIDVRTAEGQGTTFTLFLPLQP